VRKVSIRKVNASSETAELYGLLSFVFQSVYANIQLRFPDAALFLGKLTESLDARLAGMQAEGILARYFLQPFKLVERRSVVGKLYVRGRGGEGFWISLSGAFPEAEDPASNSYEDDDD
jgi:hypothetical protein